jgi:hypothetical protein
MNTSPEVSASSPFDNPSRFGGRAPDIAGASSAPESPFDSQPMLALHDKLSSWYDAEWNRQASNRFQQALDEDFYDGMQWTQEDAQALIERGQEPLVFNEVKPTIDWIIGTERRTRVDYKILPREKDDEALAEIKTKLMKYVSDANKLPWHRSMAFADAIKGGAGWLEVGFSRWPLAVRRGRIPVDWRYPSVRPEVITKRFIFSHSVLREIPSKSAVLLTLPSQRLRALWMCLRSVSSTIACRETIGWVSGLVVRCGSALLGRGSSRTPPSLMMTACSK